MKRNVLFLSILCLSLAFTACNKNEEGNNDNSMYEKWILAPNDLEKMGLFGKVKSYAATEWENSFLQNNEIVPGYESDKYEYKFNEAGYITILNKYFYNSEWGKIMLKYVEKYIYDESNKIVMIEYFTVNDGVQSPSNRSDYIYDDINKTVTKNVFRYENGEWYKSYTTTYKQNKYGRMDEKNYEYVREETRSKKVAAKYDAYGNITEYYELDNEGAITDFKTCTYEYYE